MGYKTPGRTVYCQSRHRNTQSGSQSDVPTIFFFFFFSKRSLFCPENDKLHLKYSMQRKYILGINNSLIIPFHNVLSSICATCIQNKITLYKRILQQYLSSTNSCKTRISIFLRKCPRMCDWLQASRSTERIGTVARLNVTIKGCN